MRRNSLFLSSTILMGVASLSGRAVAADPVSMDPATTAPPVSRLPAVSGPNGKIAVYGGGLETDDDSGEIVGGLGSFTMPLGERFGWQVDGMAADVGGEFVGSGAGHLFWRDPARGLVGVYGGGATNGLFDFDSLRLGLEADAYIGRISVEGVLGWEHLEFDAGGSDDDLFALADLAFYPTDDLRLSAGYRRWNDLNVGAVGAEYQLPMQWNGASPAVFAEGRIGEDGYRAVWGGVRVYFGPDPKSLIRRHREDDPVIKSQEDAAGNVPDGCDGFINFEGICVPTLG